MFAKLARDKHSSLLRKVLNYGQKVLKHWAQTGDACLGQML
jgi:hypothetical protein